MLAFPNAKINIGLQVLSKRKDGYHTISSILYPIPWHDILEIIPYHRLEFEQSGIEIPGNPDENLCLKAYKLLAQPYGLPPVKIHLHKVIPTGAGLGGGSSDAAFTLLLLNRMFDLKLSAKKLKEYAGILGSDCPFFIDNLPALASGTGTELQVVDLDLKAYFIGIIHPPVHVGTREAYAGVTPSEDKPDLTDLIRQPVSQWQSGICNDFELSVMAAHPEIRQAKSQLQNDGAIFTSMSGSGSAVFGLFDRLPTPAQPYTLTKPLVIQT
ncbi:MAG: 4-(cytidine 5'-diphospho)-2-C-methyl-D-erythritol kinase [Cyclobacteriaceae bacterium]|nr:4-(cytidine 5'-diphospho)-2-C-methyl-D-erythritol kinase [Cyclobacteriaceae bacterium]